MYVCVCVDACMVCVCVCIDESLHHPSIANTDPMIPNSTRLLFLIEHARTRVGLGIFLAARLLVEA